MSTKITQLKGQAFLPFPDMTQTLQSELRDRFGVTAVPANTYGELLFYNQKDLMLDVMSRQNCVLSYLQYRIQIHNKWTECPEV